MSELDRDRWILAHSPIEAKKLHAIGYISLRWNACELWLRVLLACLRVEDVGNRRRDRLRPVNIEDAQPAVERSFLEHGDRMTERNHFTASYIWRLRAGLI